MAQISMPIRVEGVEFTQAVIQKFMDKAVFKKGVSSEYKDGFYDFGNAIVEALNGYIEVPTEPRRRWIRVDERLPDKHGKYLVMCDGISTAVIRLFEGEWDSLAKVTHWMPLPNPPKGEENNANS